MSTREVFRANLKYYRKQKKLTQEKLSELIGYGETYITEIESRFKFPKPETIDIIAEKLGIKPYQLFMENTVFDEIEKKLTDNLCDAFSTSMEKYISECVRNSLQKTSTPPHIISE